MISNQPKNIYKENHPHGTINNFSYKKELKRRIIIQKERDLEQIT